jgi:hypothetical protein
MTRDPGNPLVTLLKERMVAKSLQRVELMRLLEEEGVDISKAAVATWFVGGGIKDEHRPALAKILGCSLEEIQRAASKRALNRLERRAAS